MPYNAFYIFPKIFTLWIRIEYSTSRSIVSFFLYIRCFCKPDMFWIILLHTFIGDWLVIIRPKIRLQCQCFKWNGFSALYKQNCIIHRLRTNYRYRFINTAFQSPYAWYLSGRSIGPESWCRRLLPIKVRYN